MRTVFRNSEIPGRIHALQPFLSAGKINGWLRVWEGRSGSADSFGYLPPKYHASAREAVYTVYSYGTPIGWVTEDEEAREGLRYHVPDIGYSSTTGQQQNAVLEAWAEPLKRQGEYRRHSGRRRELVRVPANATAYGTPRRARSGGLDGFLPGDVAGYRAPREDGELYAPGSAYDGMSEDAAHMGGRDYARSRDGYTHPSHP